MEKPIVLLLEDEPVIAEDVKWALSSCNCQCICAQNVGEALKLCEQYLPDIAIINFRQQAFPDGMALAKTLRTHYFMKIFFITGARWKDIESSPDLYYGHEVLYKPFTRRQLQKVITKFLP